MCWVAGCKGEVGSCLPGTVSGAAATNLVFWAAAHHLTLNALLLVPPPSLSMLLSSVCLACMSCSTYLFIGATSPLTYNVVGHLKTVFIVTSGIVFFGDTITVKKFVGVACAMAGIVWYTSTGIVPPPPPPTQSTSGPDKA